jgi:hypothetical protein
VGELWLVEVAEEEEERDYVEVAVGLCRALLTHH